MKDKECILVHTDSPLKAGGKQAKIQSFDRPLNEQMVTGVVAVKFILVEDINRHHPWVS